MKIITTLQIIVSLALIVSILLQNRGSGLSTVFGGDMGGYYTRRGLEKFLFFSSIFLAGAFLILAALSVYYGNRS